MENSRRQEEIPTGFQDPTDTAVLKKTGQQAGTWLEALDMAAATWGLLSKIQTTYK